MEAVLKRRDEDQLYSRIVALWPVLLAIVGVISSWAIIGYRVSDQDKKLSDHDQRLARLEASFGQIDDIKRSTDRLVDELISGGRRRRHE